MSVALIVRSYANDFCWLNWSVRSMRLRLSGVDERVLITPQGHIPCEETLSYFDKHIQTIEVNPDGYVSQQLDKLRAWQYTDCDYLLYTDSDVMFREPWDARSRIVDGKCLLYRSLYSDIPQWAWHWRDDVERYLAIRGDWEYMRAMPIMHCRECPEQMLQRFPDLIPRAERITDRAFSEFNLMGVFAEYFLPERYVFDDACPPQPCQVYWSHGGFTPEIEAEIEALL